MPTFAPLSFPFHRTISLLSTSSAVRLPLISGLLSRQITLFSSTSPLTELSLFSSMIYRVFHGFGRSSHSPTRPICVLIYRVREKMYSIILHSLPIRTKEWASKTVQLYRTQLKIYLRLKIYLPKNSWYCVTIWVPPLFCFAFLSFGLAGSISESTVLFTHTCF